MIKPRSSKTCLLYVSLSTFEQGYVDILHLLLALGVVGVHVRARVPVPTEASSPHDFPEHLMLVGLNGNQSLQTVSV